MKRFLLTFFAIVAATFALTQTTSEVTQLSRAQADLRYPQLATTRVAALNGWGPLRAALQDTTASTSIVFDGDSTGNEPSEWIYLFSQYLAQKNPGWNVRYRLWNQTGGDGNGDYDAAQILNAAAAGERYLDTGSGSAPANKGYLEASAITVPTGDIDVRVKLSPASGTWTGNTDLSVVIAHSGSAASGPGTGRSWSLSIRNTGGAVGFPALQWSTAGETLATANGTAAITLTAGQAGWLRFTRVASSGETKFFQSTDGATWTQIGAAVTAGSGALYPSTADLELGSRGNTLFLNGRYYEAEIRAGINGLVVSPRSIDAWTLGASATFGGAPNLDIWNGSFPGQTVAGAISATNDYYKRQMTTANPPVVVVSLGHNQTTQTGAAWVASLDSMLAKVRERYPYSTVVWSSQNPQLPAATYSRFQAIRRRELMAWANRNDVAVLDMAGAMYATGRALTDLVYAENPPSTPDRVHPTPTGSAVMKDAAVAAYDAGL